MARDGEAIWCELAVIRSQMPAGRGSHDVSSSPSVAFLNPSITQSSRKAAWSRQLHFFSYLDPIPTVYAASMCVFFIL